MLFVSILYYYITTSVRGMQYILNMAVNAKISEGLIHKLPCKLGRQNLKNRSSYYMEGRKY